MPPPTTQNEIELFKAVLIGSVYDESSWHLVENEPSDSSRRWHVRLKHAALVRLASLVGRTSMSLVRRVPYASKRRNTGNDWPMFGYSMVGRERLDNLQFCVETVLNEAVPGDFIETGVWRGGACMLVKRMLQVHQVTERKVWLADSFCGMPIPTDERDGPDLSEVGILAVTADQVRRNFERFNLLDNNVRFLEGWFADTLPNAPVNQIAVLRLDGDHYHSTMDALIHLYHRVSPHGFVIVDDYGSWESCRRAVHDFFEKDHEIPKFEKIDDTGVFWRKTATGG